MSKFNINVYCIAITTSLEKNKAYTLSLSSESIVFPSLIVDTKNFDNIEKVIIEYMRTFLMTHELELAPQIIKLHSDIITNDKKNTLNVIYGFLIKEGIKNFNSDWIEFDFNAPNTEYAPLIFEVIQKLK